MMADPTLQISQGNWFELPRETRAVKAAFVRLKTLGEALDASDQHDWNTAEAERERKRNKLKKGK